MRNMFVDAFMGMRGATFQSAAMHTCFVTAIAVVNKVCVVRHTALLGVVLTMLRVACTHVDTQLGHAFQAMADAAAAEVSHLGGC